MIHDLIDDTLLIATFNPRKAKEFSSLLKGYRIRVQYAFELSLPEPPETGTTFEENAYIKSYATASRTGFVALSDDSGLVIPALGGQPGIYSARWSGPDKDYGLAMDLVEQKLSNQADRSAFFVCVMCLCWPSGYKEFFRGEIKGHITLKRRGISYVGYEPLFIPEGMTCTVGEMSAQEKARISHRTKAFEKVALKYLTPYLNTL